MTNYADEIKRAVPATELLPFYGFPVNRAGFCHSPFASNDKTPSLKVYDGTRGWHDFSSGKGGDVIDFVREYFGLSFVDAQKKINDDFRLGLLIGTRLTRDQQKEADRKAQERRRKQAERETAQKRILTAYYSALDRWVYLDTLKLENTPKSPQEPFNDAFTYAVKHIDAASDALDEAEIALHEFKHAQG